MLLILTGAVLVLASGLLTRGIFNDSTRAAVNIALKAAGCLMALFGAMLLYS